MRLPKHFPGNRLLYTLKHRYRHWRYKGVRGVFTRHYKSNKWGNSESVSGSGSTIVKTENIRKEIPNVIRTFGVKRLFDGPCGDFNWFRLIQRDSGVEYVGGDIVAPLIQKNQTNFGDEVTRFIEIDIISDELPEADLWICRDCFIHLSNEDILSTLENFVRSKVQYLLTTTYPDCNVNLNIPTGATRPLNLQLAPFGIGEPLLSIDEIVGDSTRALGLWTQDQVAEALGHKK
jgi:hypothetical protein